jgi:tRNA A-37 threonylcarbamoyl transferase component Bud32
MENHADFEYMGYTWSVKPEYVDFLKGKVIPLVLSGEDSPAVRVIRRKPARDSFVVSFADASPEVFVKVHKYDKRREKLKAFFGASRARAEWKMGKQMFESGLPVAEPLALGECRIHGLVTGSVLVLQSIPQCISLSKYLLQKYSGMSVTAEGAENEFLRSVGRLVRRMHSDGFRHPDLHTANILVDPGSVPPKLWLVDLHSVGYSSVVSRRRRMADLAMLVFSLRGLIDDRQLCEVLSGYEPNADRTEIEALLAKLSRAARSLRRKRVRSRAKRCLKTSGSFVVERLGDNKLYRRREFDSDTIVNAVKRHNEIWGERGAEVVKSKSGGVLTTFSLSNGSDEKIYVKEFANTGFVRFLETLFYVHRGKRAWKASHKLRLRGIPCAEPIALVEEGKPGLLRKSYLIMKEIPHALRLDAFLLERYFRVSDRLTHEEIVEKRSFVREGARALRHFHARNIYHKDFSAKNLLVNPERESTMQFYCVDVDSVQFPPRLSLRRRIKNLAQLNGVSSCITMTDKIRFYKEYFEVHTLTPKHKLFIKIISLLSRRRFMLSRKADERIREKESSGAETYEDIASL